MSADSRAISQFCALSCSSRHVAQTTYWLQGVLGASDPVTLLLSCCGAGIGCMHKICVLSRQCKLVASNRPLRTARQLKTEHIKWKPDKPHLEVPASWLIITAPLLPESCGLSGIALVQQCWSCLHAEGLSASVRKPSLWPHTAQSTQDMRQASLTLKSL